MSEHLNERQKQLPGCSIEKAVLENFAKVTGKHLCSSLVFYKVAGTQTDTGVFMWILEQLFFTEHTQTTVSDLFTLRVATAYPSNSF